MKTTLNTQQIEILDNNFPLFKGSHKDVTDYVIYYDQLLAFLKDGSSCGLKNPKHLKEFEGSKYQPLLLSFSNDQNIDLELPLIH